MSEIFDLKRLYEILGRTTQQFRKGEVLEGTPELVSEIKAGKPLDEIKAGGVVEVYAMPHENEADGLEKIDMEFLTIGVDKTAAENERSGLVDLLNAYPQPDRLAAGPSYIEVGAEIGDQGAAFQLFALGKVLGLWDIITPASMGMKGAEARQLAGSGFIMITGYRPT